MHKGSTTECNKKGQSMLTMFPRVLRNSMKVVSQRSQTIKTVSTGTHAGLGVLHSETGYQENKFCTGKQPSVHIKTFRIRQS